MYKLKIKEFRNEKHLTQQELSNLTGVSRNYISELENAEHSATIEILMMLSIGLNVRPDKLIEQKRDEMILEDRQILKNKIIELILKNNKNATKDFIKTLFIEIENELNIG